MKAKATGNSSENAMLNVKLFLAFAAIIAVCMLSYGIYAGLSNLGDGISKIRYVQAGDNSTIIVESIGDGAWIATSQGNIGIKYVANSSINAFK